MPRLSRAALRSLAASIGLVLVVANAGCPSRRSSLLSGDQDEFFIPQQETAQDQYFFAERLRKSTYMSTKPEERAAQMEKIVNAYEMVFERFPDERTYTPRALCMVGMLYARTPVYKDEAMRMLARVERDYSEIDEILAPALYNQGLLYDQAGRYDEAQVKYKETFERYGASDDEELRSFATRARARYNRVRARN